MRGRFATVAVLPVVIAGLAIAEDRVAEASAGRLRAACVKLDITPDQPQWLHGYGPRQSEGIHDRIYHRMVALDDGRTRFFLVSTDLCVVSPDFYDATCRKIEKQTGIKTEQVWWAATHSHSVPEVGPTHLAKAFTKVLGDRYSHEPNTTYAAWLQDRLIEGSKEGQGRLEPARLGVGTGTSEANVNRRGRNAEGKSVLGVNPKGPVDRQIGLIRLERPDGSLLALIANYPIHGTVLGPRNRLISGDAPGIVAEYVEGKLGAPMLFVNGAEGNVAPIHSVRPDFESSHIDEFKALLGDRILDANRSIRTTTSDVTLCVDGTTGETPLRAGIEWPAELADYLRSSEDGVKWVRIPVRFLKINADTILWAAPLELFCEIAMTIRRESPFPYTFYFGITNGTLLYLPTRQAYVDGGYEPQVSPFTERAEEDFAGAVGTYLRRMARQ